MLPFKRLHSHIQYAVDKHIILTGRYTDLLDHIIVSLRGEKNWMYYMEPRRNCQSFLLDVSLQEKDGCKLSLGEMHGTYAERPTDFDQTKRNLEKNRAILKGYLDRNTGRIQLTDLEATFHPSQVPAPLPKVELNTRERQIMFCFGVLKNKYERREALSRLDTKDQEILALISKGCLKMTKIGPIMTIIGEVNRLPSTGKRSQDQW